jgi:hypothetical protein
MAQYRSEVSNKIKKRLRAEAGHKCANPGCPNRRTHIHHIREWAVYQTHDEQHMIAVCPSCHDAIHHGTIKIDDVVLYQWKRAPRGVGTIRSHIYIEPDTSAKLLLGTVAVTTHNQALVFKLSPYNRLKLSIKEADILLIDLSIATLQEQEVLRITDNHVKHEPRSDVEFLHVPGSMKITVPCTNEFIPEWEVERMRLVEPAFGLGGRMTAFAITVLRPGLVRVEGVWALEDKAVIITKERFSFLRPELPKPFSIFGYGEDTVLHQTSGDYRRGHVCHGFATGHFR